jgi:hypothetical protein
MRILTEKETWRREPIRASLRTKLTPEEQVNVRKAITYLRIRYGYEAVADKIGWTPESLRKAASHVRRQTVKLAVAIAYVARVPVESITDGHWPRRGACPHCGRASPPPGSLGQRWRAA